MNILYATDLHGNRAAIERMLEIGAREKVDALVFGGDLTPKLVAVKLEACPDPGSELEEEDAPLIGGGIIPLDMLKAGLNNTYTAALRQIQRLNQRIGIRPLEEGLRRQGYLFFQASQYYQLEDLLAEQGLLDKLAAYFGGWRGPESLNGGPKLSLSAEEMTLVDECLPGWLKECEASWSDKMRRGFAEKCSKALSLRSGGTQFEEIALSARLPECLLGILNIGQMTAVLREHDAFHQGRQGPLEEYLRAGYERLRSRLQQSTQYRNLVDETDIRSLARYTSTAQLAALATSLEQLKNGQAEFLSEYFLPLLRRWKKDLGKDIFVAFGNDDIAENIPLLEEAEREGLIRFLNGKIHPLGNDRFITGYGFVENLPDSVGYRHWEKSGGEILADLRSLGSQTDGRKTVFVIHQPPYGHLDELLIGGRLGSRGVLGFFEETQPLLALCGHVHEGPFLAKTITSRIRETVCVNTGGGHQKGLQAAVINLETLTIEQEA